MKSNMHTNNAFHGHGVASELAQLHEHGDVIHVGLNITEFYAALIIALIGIALLLS